MFTVLETAAFLCCLAVAALRSASLEAFGQALASGKALLQTAL